MTVHWDEDTQEPICLISTLSIDQNPPIIYQMRFWIETLFGQHKSRGFALNRTQMTMPEHIDRLLLAIAIASCLVLGLGTHLVIIKQFLTRQADAGATPRTACVLVNGKGFGRPRQRN